MAKLIQAFAAYCPKIDLAEAVANCIIGAALTVAAWRQVSKGVAIVVAVGIVQASKAPGDTT